MPNYRRPVVPGCTCFFTVVTYKRRRWLCTEIARTELRKAITEVRKNHPFRKVRRPVLTLDAGQDDIPRRPRRTADSQGSGEYPGTELGNSQTASPAEKAGDPPAGKGRARECRRAEERAEAAQQPNVCL
ncbi:MAG: hypothetical protein GY862_39775 [Gammaproteobacteria bacterium]|nr:hypothetical protein [Gammaproteobacteria bacterium]